MAAQVPGTPRIELTRRGWAYLSDPKGHGCPVYSPETLLFFWPHKAKHLQVARPGAPVGQAQAPPLEFPPHSDSTHTYPGVFPGPPATRLNRKPRPRSAICCPESAPRLNPGCAASCSDTMRACCLLEATLQPAFPLGHSPKVLCRVSSLRLLSQFQPTSHAASYPSPFRPGQDMQACSMQLLQHLLEFRCGQQEPFNQITHSLGLPAVFL